MLTFCPELADKSLTSIFIERKPRPFLYEKPPIIRFTIEFGVAKSYVDFRLRQNSSEIKVNWKEQVGGATTMKERENKKSGLIQEAFRLNLIKEALGLVLAIRQSQTPVS